jgi:hypothetical protein
MTCSHCRNRNHNINGCIKFIIDRLNSILNLGTDFHLASDTDGKWFKDRNGLTPNQDNYEITKSIQIIYNQGSVIQVKSSMNFNINNEQNVYISNVDNKRKIKLTTTIKHAMLLKYFPNNPELENIYISDDGYKIKYENNQFIIEVLNFEDRRQLVLTAKRIREKFNRFIEHGNHLEYKYKNIFTKLNIYINIIIDGDNDNLYLEHDIKTAKDDLFNYLNNEINADDTFIVTTGGIRPEVEQLVAEQEHERNEQRRRDNEERVRIRAEQRLIREQRDTQYRQEYQIRQRERLERTRQRQQELSRSLEVKKANLIFKTNVIETAECPVCFDELGNTNKAILRCGHQFCSDCIFTHLQKARGSDCPCCRAEYVIRPLGWLPPREI